MPPITGSLDRRRKIPLENLTPSESLDAIKADYQATKQNRYTRRRTGILQMGSHADWHYRVEADYLRLGEYARDMDRNDAVVGHTVDKAVTNTLQGGMNPDPQTGDAGIDEELKNRWQDWSDDADQCDVQGEHTFHEIETFALRHTFVDGDIVGLALREGSLQMMESHRLRTPKSTKKNVVHGVLLSDTRKRLEYWFTKEDVSAYAAVNLVNETNPIPVRDAEGNRQIFHVYNPKRVSQTRGVTAFAPVFDLTSSFEDINFAKVIQQQVVSCFAFIRERSELYAGDGASATGETIQEPVPQSGTNTAYNRTVQGIAPGMEIQGQPGEKIVGWSPNVPNEGYFEHTRLILTLIGINIGVPLVMLLMEPAGSFSAYRGAIDQARLGFRRNQRWLLNRFHKPVYRWKVRQWMADDPALSASAEKQGVDIFGCVWHKPAWPYIDPQKDAAADLLRQRNCQSSARRIQAERGHNWDEIFPEIVDDNFSAIAYARKRAVEMNGQFKDGTPVVWRELLSLPTPDGVTIKITGEDDTLDPTGKGGSAAKPAKGAANAA
jgi:lambda family phage portal protein